MRKQITQYIDARQRANKVYSKMTKNMVKYLNQMGIYDVGGLKHVLRLDGKNKKDVKKFRNYILNSALHYYNVSKPEVENKKRNKKNNYKTKRNSHRKNNHNKDNGNDGKFRLKA